ELNPHLDGPLTEARYRKAKALLDARVRTRKPAAYLLNEAWLGPHRFYVDERVIVPRSFIAEFLLKRGQTTFFRKAEKRGLSPISVLDLCTGSGCLAILAALAFPEAKVDAADLSRGALEVAKRNVTHYKVARRVRLVESDLFAGLAGRRYDLILSNPPYVTAASMRTLPEEFRREPQMALASGRDGLEHTRRILAQAKAHLNPHGLLMVEIGRNRAALERAYPKLPFKWPKVSAGAGYVFSIEREQLP
ncbi:MAG TPA: 50S ribosomal protein L3 N(5)-glutamine methyltransferase, partial [Usitatibacter sp.]|nr:50S ribosomal protein L3 N(5)-glutamine methyltransferase [Usitatibacter sp.]